MTPEARAFWILIINSLAIRKSPCNAGSGNELVNPLAGWQCMRGTHQASSSPLRILLTTPLAFHRFRGFFSEIIVTLGILSGF